MQNKYDTNIANSRNNMNMNTNMSLNQNPYINQQNFDMNNQMGMNQNVPNNSGFNSGDFVKGALIGAAVTYLLTNKGAQENIMKAFSKGSELVQAGVEELKERMEDAKAQMEAKDF